MSADKKRIDWDRVRERLRESQQALDRALTADPERLATVYRERAAALAVPRVRADRDEMLRVLVITLGRERYALEFADLVAVFPFAGCAPVPGGPPELLGVANIDGDIRSVLDLARLIGVAPGDEAGGYILVLRRASRQTAVRVDGLDQIRQLASAEWSPTATGDSEPGVRYLRGLTVDRLKILNTASLWTHPVFQGAE